MNKNLKTTIRQAEYNDVPEIVRLLAEDDLGKRREHFTSPLPQAYYAAFKEISADKNNWLMVAETEGKIVGTLQITFIPYLTYQGGQRALIEAVRIDKAFRGQGIGKLMIEWAIAKAKEKNCCLIQLTTDKSRQDALIFYTKLGFIASHEGLKLHLTASS